jgi:tyrosinase
MPVQIDIPGADTQGRVFLTWTPVQATARLVGGTAAGPVNVTLSNAGTVGGLVFDAVRTDQGASTLQLAVPGDGTPVKFWIAGEFQKPSSAYGDAVVQATDSTGTAVGTKPVMVRIRKNAQTLPAPERDRFLAALGTLNAQGQGAYRDFRDMHVAATSAEMHGNVGFLPWHRTYVLDLERALQAIDATVAVPYWRFDQGAPNIFTQDFMGEADANDRVVFRPGHALEHWVTDGQLGITRGLRFGLNDPANINNDEAATLALGGSGNQYSGFHQMEIDPHGSAHTSFDGPINFVPTAVRDPLFFMLHANVDRLWAKWQWVFHRANPTDQAAYAPPSPPRIGHNLGDTMWPWNLVTTPPRPRTAPGGHFPSTVVTPLPGATPKVQDLFDPLGVIAATTLAFAYDDVPFELPPTVVAGGSVVAGDP